MNRWMRKVHYVAGSRWPVLVSAVVYISGLTWLASGQLRGKLAIPPILTVVIGLLFVLAVSVYSIFVRDENEALRDIATRLEQINHVYVDVLSELFGSAAPVTELEDLLHREERTLEAVCQLISHIFGRVTRRECVVTVVLVTQVPEEGYRATAYVRSALMSERDKPGRTAYEVGTGKNTAFDVAVQPRVDDKPPHFWSADLIAAARKGAYSNERPDFARFYKSAIVVPIRRAVSRESGTPEVFDMVGYLCVDTLSRNRLNDQYHVHLLASFALQMYNFLSLVRGRYRVGQEYGG